MSGTVEGDPLPQPLSELLSVQFDDVRVKVLVLDKLDPEWIKILRGETSLAFASRMRSFTPQIPSSFN